MFGAMSMRYLWVLLALNSLGGCGSESTRSLEILADGSVLDIRASADATVAMTALDAQIIALDAAQQPIDMATASGDAEVQVAFAQCNTPLGGESWENPDLTEAQPDFEAALMSVSIEGLPATIDISQLGSLYRGMLAYTLDIPADALGNGIDTSDMLSRGMLGRVAAASLALGEADGSGLDLRFLRRGLHRYYHCDRNFPRTLEGFRAMYFDYPGTGSTDVESIAKCGVRRLYVEARSGAYVAESVQGGEVRETEILLTGLRQDGNLDFLVYDADGHLTDRTRFPRRRGGSHVMAASPYVCMACHTNLDRNQQTVRFDVLFPDVGPCPQ